MTEDLKIVLWPDPILRRIMPDTDFEDTTETVNELEKQVAIRLATERPFVGLAANQIGIEHRVCVIQRNDDTWLSLINPHIVYYGSEVEVMIEGCGSLPEIQIPIIRPVEILVQHDTHYDNGPHTEETILQDWEARIAQHEIDHLNGILIVDRYYPDPEARFGINDES